MVNFHSWLDGIYLHKRHTYVNVNEGIEEGIPTLNVGSTIPRARPLTK